MSIVRLQTNEIYDEMQAQTKWQQQGVKLKLIGQVIRRYFPDFLIRLDDERYLILEVKGQESDQDRVKRRALSDWCRAVNQVKHYGHWCCVVSRSPADIDGIIAKYI
ncbi:MAG: hypothetical protein IJT58_03230 [Synergistaceae bacterium]|nr:hypothetical protein [Synergistaceae bacterium]